jgi:hypothetical protein
MTLREAFPMSFMQISRTVGVVALVVVGSTAGSATPDKATEGMVTRSDLEIVECLLPGQVRQLGNRTYLSPRRPTRTTTSDCRIRGGEYVAYDRADVKSALRFWLSTAESGDPEAQNNVGEIYERGTGAQPDYALAAAWYGKAAQQGYPRAQVNLGLLYEQGLGVERDPVKALNLYRQAAGLPANSVIYSEAAQREQDELRATLQGELTKKDTQIDALGKQVSQLEEKLRTSQNNRPATSDPSPELAALRSLVVQLQSEKSKVETQLAGLPTRSAQASPPPQPLDPQSALRTVSGQTLGRFYALIFGNQVYSNLDSLQTPHNDAARVAQILKDRYGFSVRVLDDANDVTMLQALNDLDKVVRPEDNVLIYYAGHGWRLTTGTFQAGYWLPTNADRPPNDTFWVPNEQITAHIARLSAKRVLIVADSCYAGLLSGDPSANVFGADGVVSAEYLKYKVPKRARLLISSGGDQPVLDVGGHDNSVFAQAFLDALQSNDTVLSTPALFAHIRDRLAHAGTQSSFKQTPELKTIKSAGHEMGDFFFVPAGRS